MGLTTEDLFPVADCFAQMAKTILSASRAFLETCVPPAPHAMTEPVFPPLELEQVFLAISMNSAWQK